MLMGVSPKSAFFNLSLKDPSRFCIRRIVIFPGKRAIIGRCSRTRDQHFSLAPIRNEPSSSVAPEACLALSDSEVETLSSFRRVEIDPRTNPMLLVPWFVNFTR